MSVAPLSLANVQGDILFGLPKQTQSFFLFQIDQADAFRSNLANLVPLITTAEQTRSNITEIRKVKLQQNLAVDEGDGETVHPDVVTVSGVNIAFSAKGLQKMGILEELGDRLFQSGMKADAQGLGDNGVLSSDGTFQPDWDAAFLEEIHGVGLITGDNHESVNDALANVKNILSDTVKEIATISGDVRPDDQKGHEHFGYKDGISEPSVMGVDGIKPGQTPVKQGVVLLGRDGDSGNRPDWALDGSFLALRKLPQLVPEFDKFLLDTAGTQQSADLMGARFVGRWKSGAPVVNATTQDDPELGDDAERNNLFKFKPNDQSACPFAAHIRKMNPRGDLSEGTIQPHMILRRGIPFGPEVSDAERDSHTTTQERGLLFVCYQSDLGSGFSFLQQAWANQPGFPFGVSPTPGFDPIIGQQTGGGVREMTGAFADDTAKPLNLLAQWVNSKGGEYFFSPSIPALRDTFAKA